MHSYISDESNFKKPGVHQPYYVANIYKYFIADVGESIIFLHSIGVMEEKTANEV